MNRTSVVFAGLLLTSTCCLPTNAIAQEKAPTAPVRGSLIEERAARKLVEAGDSRYESNETKKAVEIWQSVIERYPRSKLRYQARMRLGNYFLDRDRAYDRARAHFQVVASDENGDDEQRAEATLKTGVCFYEARNFGKCFQIMREVIESFPVSPQVNSAYYYIGLGHFQLGHYSRAIAALEKVGTTLAGEKGKVEKVEAGKRLFVKIEDADLAAIESGTAVSVRVETVGGDLESVKCFPVGRNVRVVLGSVVTKLGKPIKNNGILEVRGDDKVKVVYTDQHTADKQFDRPVDHVITVVGNGVVAITDGAFSETLHGVVLGKAVNIQISDADRDLTDKSDSIQAITAIYRRKTDAEIEEERAKLIADGKTTEVEEDGSPKVDRYKKVDSVTVILAEAVTQRRVSTLSTAQLGVADDDKTPATTAPESKVDPEKKPSDSSIHTGIFQASVLLENVETPIPNDAILQAIPGDVVRITYVDALNISDDPIQIQSEAKCLEGNLGGVRVTRAVISDAELRIQTRLKTASALTNIGNRYKEFGLKKNADAKYNQALDVCEEIMGEARKVGGRLLEQTYVQLWQVYFEMDKLELAAAMAQRLQRDFPNSGFVDDALLQLADVARKQANLRRAIGLYSRLVSMKTSQLRGEAQFGIAQCYDQMAEAANTAAQTQLRDRAFQEYKKVFDNFPDSGRVGEAVSQMANYYYQQKDFSRAVDTFETVLSNYPDAKFLDVILFNYGRCLYRMDRRTDARRRFDQLISDFPESPLAGDAKKISDALAKAGGS
jgi:TolA-binding protein